MASSSDAVFHGAVTQNIPQKRDFGGQPRGLSLESVAESEGLSGSGGGVSPKSDVSGMSEMSTGTQAPFTAEPPKLLKIFYEPGGKARLVDMVDTSLVVDLPPNRKRDYVVELHPITSKEMITSQSLDYSEYAELLFIREKNMKQKEVAPEEDKWSQDVQPSFSQPTAEAFDDNASLAQVAKATSVSAAARPPPALLKRQTTSAMVGEGFKEPEPAETSESMAVLAKKAKLAASAPAEALRPTVPGALAKPAAAGACPVKPPVPGSCPVKASPPKVARDKAAAAAAAAPAPPGSNPVTPEILPRQRKSAVPPPPGAVELAHPAPAHPQVDEDSQV